MSKAREFRRKHRQAERQERALEWLKSQPFAVTARELGSAAVRGEPGPFSLRDRNQIGLSIAARLTESGKIIPTARNKFINRQGNPQ